MLVINSVREIRDKDVTNMRQLSPDGEFVAVPVIYRKRGPAHSVGRCLTSKNINLNHLHIISEELPVI